MARRFNGKPTFISALSASIQNTLQASAGAAERILAGTPMPGDVALLRAGEKSIEFLLGKAAS